MTTRSKDGELNPLEAGIASELRGIIDCDCDSVGAYMGTRDFVIILPHGKAYVKADIGISRELVSGWDGGGRNIVEEEAIRVNMDLREIVFSGPYGDTEPIPGFSTRDIIRDAIRQHRPMRVMTGRPVPSEFYF